MSTNLRHKLPPGPRSLFPWRQLIALRRDPPNFLRRMAEKYGDVSHFQVGGQKVFLINHPDLIKDVLVTRQHLFTKGDAMRRAKFLLGEGLLTSEGEHHDRQRRLILPAFHRQRIARYCDLMVAHAARARELWEDGGAPDINTEIKRLTMNIVCDALFGADVGDEFPRVAASITGAFNRFHVFGPPGLNPVVLLRSLGPWRRSAPPNSTARDTLNAIVYRIIADRRRDGEEDCGDLLSMLLRAEVESGEGGAPMNDTQVRDEVVTLFLAGYETIANTLTVILHQLSKHPEEQTRLHAELDEVLAERLPTADDIPRLTYAGMLLTETLRNFPPSWINSRRAKEDVEIAGYVVPAGAMVLMSQYVMHHDARYFPDPFRFDPERWTEEARRARPEFSYFPFGGGKRRCIGEGFALAEGVMLLSTIAQRWRFSPVTGNPVEFRPGLIMRPVGDLRLRVERRSATG
ncbi:MAG TPA: cytochrome P450 [Pyrinomonadaceae bacterium]|nr:cytochrome P450 [Pyrinomonadaceae bacterium]